MAKELCRGSYSVQCFPDNDSGVPYSVLVSANGSHRTTGYRTYLELDPTPAGVPSFSLYHDRTDEPDLQMMTQFQATFAFSSPTAIANVKIRDAKGEQIVETHNLPTLISTCPA
jgi:hypothetical protein